MGIPDTRDRILEAAFSCFSQRSFHDVKIADVARAAGVGKGTVYEYFSSKEDLHEELFRYLTGHYLARMQENIAGCGGAVEKLRRLYISHMEMYQEILERDGGMLLIDEMMRAGRSGALKEHGARIQAVVREVLEQGVEEGAFRRDLDPDTALLPILIGFLVLGHRVCARQEEWLSPSADQYLDLLLRGIGRPGEDPAGT